MKKVLWVFAILIVLVIGGVAIFIATFDANRYRPLVVGELQKALGHPVTLQRISLGWRNGIAAELQGLVIADSDAAAKEPLLQLDSASALVRLWPLLRHNVQVTSIALLRPRVHVARRSADGKINLLGLAVVAGPVAASHPPAGNSPITFNVESVQLRQGVIHWTDAASGSLQDVTISDLDVTVRHIVPGRPMDVQIAAALFSQAQNIRFTGRVTLPAAGNSGAIEEATVNADNLPIGRFLPPGEPGQPSLRGLLTLRLQGAVSSFNPLQAVLTSSATGRIMVTDAVVERLNLLRIVFDRLSMLPGVVAELEAKLPASYQSKLAAQDTVFAPIDMPIRFDGGALRCESIELRSDTFRLSGSGEFGVNGAVQMRTLLRIEPELSGAIIRSVSELGALANASGEIEIPLTIQGQALHLAALPDLKYVASKVIVTKAVDVLERLLKPKSERSSPDTSQDATTQQAPPTTEELVGHLLQRALRKHLPAESPSQ